VIASKGNDHDFDYWPWARWESMRVNLGKDACRVWCKKKIMMRIHPTHVSNGLTKTCYASTKKIKPMQERNSTLTCKCPPRKYLVSKVRINIIWGYTWRFNITWLIVDFISFLNALVRVVDIEVMCKFLLIVLRLICEKI
jgi:hypothetical protein